MAVVTTKDASFGQTVDPRTVSSEKVLAVVGTERDRGRTADRPQDIPGRGWWDVLMRVRAESKADHVTLLAAGVGFYGLLALVPAIAAMVTIYGLVADPDDVRRQVLDLLQPAPREVSDLVAVQLESIASSSNTTNLFGLVIAIVTAMWAASAGVDHLIDALNVAYDESEQRGFIRRKAISLGLTIGAVIFVVSAIGVITAMPTLLEHTGLGVAGQTVLGVLRWAVLGVGLVGGLATVYRMGPDRDSAKWRWVSPGALIAAVVWVAGSLLFSLYTANFASYNDTYGALAAIVVVMLWLMLTAFIVILGAEINSELERQTAHDTTEGAPVPIGGRGAYAADTVGRSVDDVATETVDNGVVANAVDVDHDRSVSTFPFVFAGVVGLAARLFGVRSDRAHLELNGERLTVRYGSWVATTTLGNVQAVDVTGPYRRWKVAGPPHLSFADGGITFATNDDLGLCIRFHDPVAALLPFGLITHDSLTCTVADPDRVAAVLSETRQASS